MVGSHGVVAMASAEINEIKLYRIAKKIDEGIEQKQQQQPNLIKILEDKAATEHAFDISEIHV